MDRQGLAVPATLTSSSRDRTVSYLPLRHFCSKPGPRGCHPTGQRATLASQMSSVLWIQSSFTGHRGTLGVGRSRSLLETVDAKGIRKPRAKATIAVRAAVAVLQAQPSQREGRLEGGGLRTQPCSGLRVRPAAFPVTGAA